MVRQPGSLNWVKPLVKKLPPELIDAIDGPGGQVSRDAPFA